jgi:hypothetical protein
MKYRKFNKYEKREEQAKAVAQAMHGEGLYLYENNTDATLTLPRPTKSGVRVVGARKQFQGDNYYMSMVPIYLRYIKELQSPQQERQAMNEQKLILDQPDTITHKGKVEHVVDKQSPSQKLNEQGGDDQGDILLNEGPVDNGFVIVGE